LAKKRKNAKKKKVSFWRTWRGFALQILLVAIAVTAIYIYDSLKENRSNDRTLLADDIAQVHFIDVGQGDCALITVNGENVMIDCGEVSYGASVLNYLDRNNIAKLDYFIVTHPHSDHMGCISELIENVEVDNIIMPNVSEKNIPTTRFYQKFLEVSKGIEITAAATGMVIEIGSAEFTFISPELDTDSLNETSLCVIFEHGENSFVFTGDAETKSEKAFLDSGLLIDCDVYKAGHHGSNTSSTHPFLDVILPEYTVVTCGIGNSYGHPSEIFLDRISEYTTSEHLFRLDILGSTVFESDGTHLSVKFGDTVENLKTD